MIVALIKLWIKNYVTEPLLLWHSSETTIT